MKLSFHHIKGKASPEQLRELGDDWITDQITWDDAFDLITVDGNATSTALTCDNRSEPNFLSGQLVMIDIDDGMTIQELLQDPFYNQYGAGFYATPSHTDDDHRFRIMFRLEQAETNKQRYRHIVLGLMMYYPGDPACKDATRLFYGTPNCTIKEKTNRVLTNEVVEGLIFAAQEHEQQETEKLQVQTNSNYDKEDYDIEFIEELLRRIQVAEGSLRGEYDTWRSVAWAVCHALGVQNAQSLMMKYFSDKTQLHLQTIKSYKPGQAKNTVGTLVHLSKINKEDLYKLNIEFKQRNNLLTDEELLNNLIRENRKRLC
jgi:hypothetical protein